MSLPTKLNESKKRLTFIHRLNSQWKSYLGSKYLKPILELLSGQSIAMVLPILAAPALGRLYLPEDYGALGLYLGVSAVLGTLASLQLHEAILAEKSDTRAEELVFVCLVAGFTVALLATILAAALSISLTGVPSFQSAGQWIWMLPFSVLIASFSKSIGSLCTRIGSFRYLAVMPVMLTLTTVGLSLLFGFWQWGANGLLASYFAGQIVVGSGATWMFLKLRPNRGSHLSWWVLVKRHRRFVTYTLPSRFVGEANLQMPVYALGLTGSGAFIGLFTRARTLVTLPIALIGRAIGQVYRKKASEDYRTTGTCRIAFHRTFIGLALIAAPSMSLLAWLGPDLFAIFLGPNWRGAGEIARILAPMLFLRMITAPLSSTLLFTNGQKIDYFKELATAALMMLVFYVLTDMDANPTSVVIAFSALMVTKYIFVLFVSYQHTEKRQ